MNDITLVVMAAGIGSRFGGLKQVAPAGPSGEAIVEYSIFDAMRAGFNRVVFVIRREIEDDFVGALGRRLEKQLPVAYVFQDEAVPATPGRTKLWGTAQAVLAAAPVVAEPFAAINADDYYGDEAFRRLADHLRSGGPDSAMVGFRLDKTLSEFGPVRRGLCAVQDGYLREVTELENVQREVDAFGGIDPAGVKLTLRGDETVSMNIWGFPPAIFDEFQSGWSAFWDENRQSETAEFYIPSLVTNLIDAGRARFRVLPTSGTWFGVTYREDLPETQRRINDLVEQGVYPSDLWSG